VYLYVSANIFQIGRTYFIYYVYCKINTCEHVLGWMDIGEPTESWKQYKNIKYINSSFFLNRAYVCRWGCHLTAIKPYTWTWTKHNTITPNQSVRTSAVASPRWLTNLTSRPLTPHLKASMHRSYVVHECSWGLKVQETASSRGVRASPSQMTGNTGPQTNLKGTKRLAWDWGLNPPTGCKCLTLTALFRPTGLHYLNVAFVTRYLKRPCSATRWGT